jgi:hypothetical protein
LNFIDYETFDGFSTIFIDFKVENTVLIDCLFFLVGQGLSISIEECLSREIPNGFSEIWIFNKAFDAIKETIKFYDFLIKFLHPVSHLVSIFIFLLKTCWKLAKNLLKTCWKLAENLLKTCWKLAENLLKTCWKLAKNLLKTCWNLAEILLKTCWKLAVLIQTYYRLQAKLNICVKYTVHKTQLAENKNREIKNKLRAKLRMKKNFQC